MENFKTLTICLLSARVIQMMEFWKEQPPYYLLAITILSIAFLVKIEGRKANEKDVDNSNNNTMYKYSIFNN